MKNLNEIQYFIGEIGQTLDDLNQEALELVNEDPLLPEAIKTACFSPILVNKVAAVTRPQTDVKATHRSSKQQSPAKEKEQLGDKSNEPMNQQEIKRKKQETNPESETI